MAGALWSGSLSFGLVNVPVALLSAVRDRDVHFHQLRESDHRRIEVRRYCTDEDKEVPWEEIAHGYELDDECVMVTDAELEALEPRRTRTIDIEQFVPVGQIDPNYFDHPYFLVPAGGGEGAARAYRLLAGVMERSERAALGRFVLRTREYLVALRVRDGAIALSTLLFADELRPVADLGDAVPSDKRHKPTRTQVDRAVALIDAMSAEFDPTNYTDCHRRRLLDVIAAKRDGEEIEAPGRPEVPKPAPDLMEALKESLVAAKA